MNENRLREQTHLFLLRVSWRLDGNGESSCHGKLQHVLSGRAEAFEGWPALESLLAAMSPDRSDQPGASDAGADRT